MKYIVTAVLTAIIVYLLLHQCTPASVDDGADSVRIFNAYKDTIKLHTDSLKNLLAVNKHRDSVKQSIYIKRIEYLTKQIVRIKPTAEFFIVQDGPVDSLIETYDSALMVARSRVDSLMIHQSMEDSTWSKLIEGNDRVNAINNHEIDYLRKVIIDSNKKYDRLKRKRFSFGPAVGIGYSTRVQVYVGVDLQYSLYRF